MLSPLRSTREERTEVDSTGAMGVDSMGAMGVDSMGAMGVSMAEASIMEVAFIADAASVPLLSS